MVPRHQRTDAYIEMTQKKSRRQALAEHARYQREFHTRLRLSCLVYYSGNPPKCACCGENEIKFLAIDHIEGGGTQHRKVMYVEKVGSIYRWLKNNKFPNGFQVLCHNCNSAKGYYGSCPHKEDRSCESA